MDRGLRVLHRKDPGMDRRVFAMMRFAPLAHGRSMVELEALAVRTSAAAAARGSRGPARSNPQSRQAPTVGQPGTGADAAGG